MNAQEEYLKDRMDYWTGEYLKYKIKNDDGKGYVILPSPLLEKKVSKVFSANRVVLILHAVFIIATAVAVFVAAVSNSLPHAWQADAALGVTLLTAVAGGTVAVTKFLNGSQAVDAQQASIKVDTNQQEHEKWLVSAGVHPANFLPTVVDTSTTEPITDGDEFSDLPPESSRTPDGATVTDVTDVTDTSNADSSAAVAPTPQA